MINDNVDVDCMIMMLVEDFVDLLFGEFDLIIVCMGGKM